MNPQNDEIEIDLREILFILIKRIWIILAAIVIGGLVAGLISLYGIAPKYKSTSKIYILTNSESMISLTDLQMGSNLANDYQELIKSRPVVEGVIKSLKLNMQYGELLSYLTIENPTNTRIIYITIEYTDPQIAMELANEFVEVAKGRISQIMKVDEPTIAEKAIVPKAKSSPNNVRNALLGVFIGFLLSVAIVLVIHALDDTIKNSDDVERYLGIQTLASIPEEGGTDNKEKSQRKGRRKNA